MKNKKGSHVGAILSFFVFVTFVVFVYVILQPGISQGNNKENCLRYLEYEVLERTNSNLTILTIALDEGFYSPSSDCISFEEPIDFATLNIKVMNEDEEEVDYSTTSEEISLSWNGESFYKIHSSPESLGTEETSLDPCQSLDEGDYEIGTIQNKEYLFEEKIVDLINNYETTQNEIYSAVGTYTGIGFVYENGTEINTGEIDVDTSIYVESYPLNYINKNGEIKAGELILKVW